MSRIGKLPIHVPAGVTVTIKDNVVTVKGPKGEMTQAVNPDINVTLEDGIIHLTRPTDEKNHRALHGLYRSLINNIDRKSTRLNSSHDRQSRMPSSA